MLLRKIIAHFRNKDSINDLHFNGENSYTYFGNYGKRVEISVDNADIHFRIYFGIFQERLVYAYSTNMSYNDHLMLRKEKAENKPLLESLHLKIFFNYIHENILIILSEKQLQNVVSFFNDNKSISFSTIKDSFINPLYKNLLIYNIRQFGFFKGEFPSTKYFNFFFQNKELFIILDPLEFNKVKDFIEYPSNKAGANFNIIRAINDEHSWRLICDDSVCNLYFDSKENKYFYTSRENKRISFDESSFPEMMYSFCIDILRDNKNTLNIDFLQLLENYNIELETMTPDEYQTILMYEY